MQVASNSGWISGAWKVQIHDGDEHDPDNYVIAVEFASGYIGYWHRTAEEMYDLINGGGKVFHSAGWYGQEDKSISL
jgi:hypothetical protein